MDKQKIDINFQAHSWGFWKGVWIDSNIYWQGLLNTSAERREPLGVSGGMPPENFAIWRPYFQHCASQYFKLDGV